MDFSAFEDVGDRWNDPDYIAEIKKSIAAWKSAKPSVVAYILGVAAMPLSWVINRLIPKSAIRGALSGLDWCAKHTITAQSARDPENLAQCDRNANLAINLHIAAATAEGGAAGFFGIVALPADIPMTVAIALRAVRQVGAEYGYTDDNEQETQFVFSVLSATGANSQAEKAEALAMAAYLMNVLAKQTWKAMAAKAAAQQMSVEGAIIAVKSLAKQLGINLTKRKSLAAIPVIGAAVGASANGWFLREVGIAAQRLFPGALAPGSRSVGGRPGRETQRGIAISRVRHL